MTDLYAASRLHPCSRHKQHRTDRRNQHTKSLLYSLFKRRRISLRRDDDRQHGFYVDVHEPRMLMWGVAILLLSCMDAYFTLLLLPYGAYEVNPLMRLLIETDYTLFIKTKIAITAFGVVFLIAHKNFWFLKNTIRVPAVMSMTLVMYFVLVNYQIGMLILHDRI